MRSRRFLTSVCGVLVLTAACTGHGTKVLGTTKTRQSNATPHSSTAPVAPPGVPKVILQSGTSYQNGALVQFCTGSACQGGVAKQAHALPAADPLLFIIDTVPVTARIQLTRGASATVSATAALHVGSLMVYAPTVRPGYYIVHFDATWPSNKHGSWVFQIAIPKT